MTAVELERGAIDDLDRITDYLMRHDADNAVERKDELLAALRVLTYAPEIGRRSGAGTRELVVGRAARGYVVRYRYSSSTSRAWVTPPTARCCARSRR